MNRHIRKAMYMIGITALAVAFAHAAEVGGIITQQLDAGAALSRAYNAKVARQDKVKAWKELADSTPIDEDFTTATLAAINAAYDRIMAVDLTAAQANAETYETVMAIRVHIQGFRAEAVNRQAKIAALMERASFENVSPELKAAGASCIGIIDQVVTAYENEARQEFIDYKEPK